MFIQQAPMSYQHDNNFKVYARIRPYNQEQDNTNDGKYPFNYGADNITVELKNMDHTFTYDKVYEPETTQEEIFNTVGKKAINNAFEGINSTIFSYGQTCSGKTHTIVGDFKQNKVENEGLLPRILKQLLNRRTSIIEQNTSSSLDVRLKLSMVEIYNEKIIDLLADQRVCLRLRESKKKGVFVEELTQKYISSTQEGMEYVVEGLQQRTVGKTNQNTSSSRSHMVVTVTVIETDFHKKQALSAKLMLVDLAGSQRLSRAGIHKKIIHETKKINLSLSTLSKVITAITDPLSRHVPYRDSKLTRLLKQSLGGNALTNLIVNISPLPSNINQSLSSLRFGARAKMIKNKPRVNKAYTIEELLSMLEKAQERIYQLMKYVGKLERVIGKNVMNGDKLVEVLRNERTVIDLNIIEGDFYREDDTPSQTSTSQISQSLNCLSQTAGSQGNSIIKQLQTAIMDMAHKKLKKSQSCLNITAKQFSLDRNELLFSQKLHRISQTPKNLMFRSAKQEGHNYDSCKKSIQQDQRIVSIFDTINCDSQINKIQDISPLKSSKGMSLRLQSGVVNFKIESKFQLVDVTITTLDLNQSQIELNHIRSLHNKCEQKLAKYKKIIKQQDSYIAELKQRHKAKKLKLSKEISQLQYLCQQPN